MRFQQFTCFITGLLLLVTVSSSGQNRAIGQWRSHLSYNKLAGVATDGNKIFAAGLQSFFTYDLSAKEISTYSKVEGMSDVGLTYIAHDVLSGITILAYSNSNIDLFKDETFYNIPDIKLKTVTSDKSIYHIHIENSLAYLSTGLGIIVLNLDKKEIKETYVFTKDGQSFTVRGLAADAGNFYAATALGLYKTSKKNPNIQASASWSVVNNKRSFVHTTMALNRIFAATTDSVFTIDHDTLQYVFSRPGNIIAHLDDLDNQLGIAIMNNATSQGNVLLLNESFLPADSIISGYPRQAIRTLDGDTWVADAFYGLRTNTQAITPEGPADPGTYDIIAENKKVYVAHGSYDDKWNIPFPPNLYGVSVFEDDKWKTYNQGSTPKLTGLEDAIRLAKDPTDNTLYIASLTQGVYYLKTDMTTGRYREGYLEPHKADPSTYRASGVTFDKNNNLWVSQNNAEHELVVRAAADGKWYKIGLPNLPTRPYWENGAADVIVDDYNQKWFFSPAGGGVLVLNDNNTISNPADDTYRNLTSGKSLGNLPDNLVQCLVNDRKGLIWIGTANGIGIINCPDRVISGACEAEIRVVQYDQFPGQLFVGQNVKTIAVDGANRKWVGTNNGVWLISEDGGKIISRFTAENSPLPSNTIQVIRIDPVTGDVYIGTANGLISYRGTATTGRVSSGGEDNSDKKVSIFPNPVKSGYSGLVAIKGLPEDADVRITDISGQLVYRTKALGGQAVWNGLDYTGRRPQSGVFLVFVSNSDGTDVFSGKLVFIK